MGFGLTRKFMKTPVGRASAPAAIYGNGAWDAPYENFLGQGLGASKN